MAFFITSLVRTAQGSATVAMITAVGIIGGMVSTASLDFHPVYLALMIGCGSKPFPWMNDSGFWVVCKMSGMTEKEALKTFSAVLGIMGYIGLVVIMILANLFPLV
jgi:GntP family gluconate:H+ symporter